MKGQKTSGIPDSWVANSWQHTVFSQLNAPRHLFQTWHGGHGVFLKKQFIWACHFLRKGHYSFFFAAM